MPVVDITDVGVLGMYRAYLNRNGTGSVDRDARNQLTRLVCEVFVANDLPAVGTDYSVSWTEANLPKQQILRCSVSAAPASSFVPPPHE